MLVGNRGVFNLVCFIFIVALSSFLFFSPVARGQAQTAGQITGQVLDASKASIADATVTATNVATGAVRKIQTDSQGHYALADLPVGTYNVSAEHAGFQEQTQTGVVLNVATTVQLNLTLSVGAVSQEVVVTSEAPIINKADASTGTVLNNQQVGELPINGRDYARFSLLTPGAVFRSNYIADLTFDGLHSVHNQFSIDGIDASRVDEPYMANGFERGARLLTGSLDTVDEFNVQTSDYSAEYGRAAGSYINIATKSGTNDFHGTSYDYFRNNILDARNFFATTGPAPEFRFNDFGGNLGGPILKKKSFFFINYEGSRQRIGITGSGTVPSNYERGLVLADSPQLEPILDMFPIGTSPGTDQYTDNYTTTQVSDIREDTGSVRFDEIFSDHDSAFVRVNVNDSHVHGPLFGVIPSSLGVDDHQNVPLRTTNVAIHEEHIFNDGMVNDFLAGMQRWGSQIDSGEPLPLTTVVGYSVVPGTQGNFLENNTSFQYGDTMSMVKGRHTLTWGGTIYRIWVNSFSTATPTMQFNSPEDFYDDQLSTVTIVNATPGNGTRATQVGAFITDKYQILPTLSLNIGLRYDIETVPHDSRYATEPYDTRIGALGAPGDPYFAINDKDFGPRVGLAWSPISRIVVRSGYGIYFQDYPVGFGSYYVPGNTVPGNITLLQQQIPTLSYPYEPFISQAATLPPPNVAGFPWNKPDIYANQWNLSVADQFSQNMSFQIAYVGNHGVNLWREEGINYYDPTLGARPNPNYGNITLQTNSGFSSYNALQLSLKRRMSTGLLFETNYTWGHAIDDVEDQGLFSSDPQNLNNLAAERGNGSGDVRQNFTFNLLYNLPIGTGHKLFSSGFGSRLASGWRVSTLGILRTGVADTIYIGTNTYGNEDFINQRPNCVAGVDPYASPKTVTDWLNPLAFSMPAAGTFGNCGRNTIFGPGFKNADFSMLKETRLGETRNLEFRAEFFNIFNHPAFAQPDTTYGTAGFGQIFDTLGSTIGEGTSRQIQLALKFTF
ncbi:MAG: carboxypeptidase regulatory-like domain-containing protein [Candidatus Acidiferrum sp.]